MCNEDLLRLTRLPVDELRKRARIPFRLLADREALLNDFADAILEEIRFHNRRDERTRFILPVGPIAHYRRVVEISNREKLRRFPRNSSFPPRFAQQGKGRAIAVKQLRCQEDRLIEIQRGKVQRMGPPTLIKRVE